MNTKSRICLYMIALSFLLFETFKLNIDNRVMSIPIYFFIPSLVVAIGLLINLIQLSHEEDNKK